MNEEEVDLIFKMIKEMMFNRDEYPKDRFDEYRKIIKDGMEKIRKDLYKRKPRNLEENFKSKPVKETKEEIDNWMNI
jgi:hypothetical protein